jgi:hypothetical protein
MNYGSCPHEDIANSINKHMEILCDEATKIRKTISEKNGAYLGQIDRLMKICIEIEDFALIFDQAAKQTKKLALEMKNFNETIVTRVKESTDGKSKKPKHYL